MFKIIAIVVAAFLSVVAMVCLSIGMSASASQCIDRAKHPEWFTDYKNPEDE